jgi:alcohol dehydrogenase
MNGTLPALAPGIVGHEGAGEVAQVGSAVTDLAVGDHVIIAFVPPCGACPSCLRGQPHLCAVHAVASFTSPRFAIGETEVFGFAGSGTFAEELVVPRAAAVKVDPEVPFEVAALVGCGVLTGVGAVVNAARVRPGESVAVFGLGGVGLAALLGALAAGAEPVYAIDRVQSKLAMALDLGARRAFDAGAPSDVVDAVREASGGGVDHAIETVGNAAVLAQACAATRRGGITTTVGLPDPSVALTLPAVSLAAEERTLRGSYLGSCVPSRDIPRFVALHRAGRLPVERLLTHTLPLGEINAGFERMARGEGVRQAVLFP